MRNVRKWSVWFGTMVLAASPLWATADVQYTLTGLGKTTAFGINNSGQIVGEDGDVAISYAYVLNSGVTTVLAGPGETFATRISSNGLITGVNNGQAFLYDGTMHALPLPQGFAYSEGDAINSSGWVVGELTDSSSSLFHAFLYDGAMHDLGSSTSAARGVNDAGQIVGISAEGHPFLYSNGVMQDIGTLGGNSGLASAINNSGEIVGETAIAGNTDSHPFAYINGTMHDLGALAGTHSGQAMSVNDQGVIVGFSELDSSVHNVAFVVSNGTIQDLNSLIEPSSGWHLDKAYDVNDSGQIVGVGVDPAGGMEGFLLTPSPEPGALSIIAGCTAGLLLARR